MTTIIGTDIHVYPVEGKGVRIILTDVDDSMCKFDLEMETAQELSNEILEKMKEAQSPQEIQETL